MVSYLPEIRAGMALLLAFCAMVQDLRNFKIGNRQILVGLLGAAGCMAYEWMLLRYLPKEDRKGRLFIKTVVSVGMNRKMLQETR